MTTNTTCNLSLPLYIYQLLGVIIVNYVRITVLNCMIQLIISTSDVADDVIVQIPVRFLPKHSIFSI